MLALLFPHTGVLGQAPSLLAVRGDAKKLKFAVVPTHIQVPVSAACIQRLASCELKAWIGVYSADATGIKSFRLTAAAILDASTRQEMGAATAKKTLVYDREYSATFYQLAIRGTLLPPSGTGILKIIGQRTPRDAPKELMSGNYLVFCAPEAQGRKSLLNPCQ